MTCIRLWHDVIVMITAKHLCVSSRGIKDKSSYTTTIEYGGEFNDVVIRNIPV